MPISKIGSAGIKDANLSADDLAPGSVTNDKLAGSIANAKLANQTITINGTAIALGASGSIVAGIDWQAVKTSNFTAVAGEGYFVNTTSGTITMTLPASPSAGDSVSIADYAGTFGANALSINRNGSNLQGVAADGTVSTSQQNVRFTYADSTKGWIPTIDATAGNYGATYHSATGGTETTSGDYKIHTYTSSGNFVVATAGNPAGSGSKVSYLVVAGGGGSQEGAGGGGGFREGTISTDPYAPAKSPLAAPDGITITAQTYPITVGAGGASSPNPAGPTDWGSPGGTSTFSTITSAGGGGGGRFVNSSYNLGRPGGSGGGAAGYPGRNDPGGTGNTPPVSPPQGNNGGPNNGGHPSFAGGGGGATAVGGTSAPNKGGDGGAGASSSITGSAVTRSGGGGGGCNNGVGAGGAGGGGTGDGPRSDATGGTANTGGGAGGTWNSYGHNGGSGIVVIRYKYQN